MKVTNISEIGVDLDYWYPVIRDKDLKKGRIVSATVWHKPLIVYRAEDGRVHALDDHCAHRRVALLEGQVKDCRLVCPYHGWEYDSNGRLVAIPYWPKEKRIPRLNITSYPTTLSNGIVWIFPGDPEKAASRNVPDTSAVDTPEWLAFRLDRDFSNHYGIGLINGMDYFHFYLHRRFQPWSDIGVTHVESSNDHVSGEFRIVTTRGFAARFFKTLLGHNQNSTVTQSLKVHYLYPHHLAEIDEDMKVWAFFRPVHESLVKVFITTYIRSKGINRLYRYVLQSLLSPLLLRRIQREDAWIGMQEQQAWKRLPHLERHEINPISVAAQNLMIERWVYCRSNQRPAQQGDR